MDLGETRRIFTTTLVAATLGLAAWTVYLAVSLPRHYVAGHWDAAWVGLDSLEVVALVATAWAAAKSRLVVVLFALVAGTLFVVDAWMDVTTARHADLFASVVVAVCVELPGALVLFLVARRAIRLVTGEWYRVAYETHAPPPWKLSLADLDQPSRDG
jgi:hypothetical protein